MYIDRQGLPESLQLSPLECSVIIHEKERDTRRYFLESGFDRAVLGLSGGIDSALALAIAVRALGRENVEAIMMPCDSLNVRSMDIAREIAQSVGLPKGNLLTVNISSVVHASWDQLARSLGEPTDSQTPDLCYGNLAARIRGVTLMHRATMTRALVFGTENRTEHALAYYTKGGDNLTDFEPFLDLWKVQIFMVGEALRLPDSVLNRAPSAELWDGQTDEGELGVSYTEIDTILTATYDQKMTSSAISQQYGIPLSNIGLVLARVAKMRGKRSSPFLLHASHSQLDF
jgi:NAD+ synthase